MGFLGDVVGGLIGGAGALGGAAISGKTARRINDQNIAFARETNAQNYKIALEERALQKEFAQMGTRWKVADAQAAGLHPLFALGGSTSTYSPVMPMMQSPQVTGAGYDTGQAVADMGQSLGGAISRMESQTERTARLLQLKALEASVAKDVAQAQYWSSEAARNKQDMGSAASFPIGAEPGIPFSSQFDTVKPVAAEIESVRSGAPSVTAGDHGGLSVHRFNGVDMLLPSKDTSEPLESLGESPLAFLATLQANRKHYGEGWYRKAMQAFFPGPLSVYDDVRREFRGTRRNLNRFGNRLKRAARPRHYGTTSRW